jgi:uncharacterized membrane protein
MPATARLDPLDTLRGAAIVWMTLYHLCFDLNYLGWLRADFYRDPFWTWQRTAIVSLFLFCAGVSQAVAHHQGQRWPCFWRRWRQVALCALLVTLGSLLLFPSSFIYFGVLHGMAVMLIVVRWTANWGRWLWWLGAVAIAMKFLGAQALLQWPGMEFLNHTAFNWLGLVSRKPITQDWVPIFPWLGVIWWGMAAGQWLLAHRPALMTFPVPHAAYPLRWLGRWSLTWYMLHQPAALALLMAFKSLSS